jgi:membrane-bound lytic murein transglycosylase MltF
MTVRTILALVAFILLLPQAYAANENLIERGKVLAPWTGDYGGMVERRMIRIAVPFSKTIYFLDKGRQYGTAVEFGQALEAWVNDGRGKAAEKKIHVVFVPLPRDELIPAVVGGKADIAAGNLTITPERLDQIDFALPFATGVREIIVTGPSAPQISTVTDLSGRTVRVRMSSSYREHLAALSERLVKEGRKPIDIRPADERLEDEDLMEMVNAGLLPWAVVDLHKAAIWKKVLPDLTIREDLAVNEGGEIAWGIRKDSPGFKAMLDKFVDKHREGTTFGNVLARRYYRDEKMLRKAYDPERKKAFERLLAIFEKYGTKYDFDMLLLAAQGFQESQLEQSRRSKRGAVGIMQLLPSTAADKAVGISGIEESEDRNIEAGAKYLRHLADTYVDGPGVGPLNRHLFALAAYNAGPGNLRKFRKEAAELGLDPDQWFNNVEHGAAEIVGRETVQYVSNIYKYYIAYKLLSEREDERFDATCDAVGKAC